MTDPDNEWCDHLADLFPYEGELGEDEPELEVEEPEVVVKMVSVQKKFFVCSRNHRGGVREATVSVKKTREVREEWNPAIWQMVPLAAPKIVTWTESRVIGTYISQGQRAHGGTDNRRYRRGDNSGKMIGNNHRRRLTSGVTVRTVRPVAILLENGDGTCRRIPIK